MRCDVRMIGAGIGVRRPTDEVKRVLTQTLNECCQLEGEDRIDWSSVTRMSCVQDFSTVGGVGDAKKNASPGVRMGF